MSTETALEWGNYYQNGQNQIIRYCPLHSAQQEIWDSTARFLFYCSGKGAGKSSFAPIWLERELAKSQGKGNYIVCAPTYSMLHQGIYPEWMRTMEYSPFGGDLKKCWNEKWHYWKTPQGGLIYFRSLDDPEKVNSIHAKAIVVDEGFLVPYSAWLILESRVARHKGRILVTSTPYKNHRWPLQLLAKSATDPLYHFVRVASHINPAFGREEYERLRGSTPEWRFKQDYDGEFVTPAGTVFGNLRDCVVSPQNLVLPDGQIFAGVDFGHGNAPSSAIVGVLDDDDVLWVFWEYYATPDSKSGKASYLETARDLLSFHNSFSTATGRRVAKWFCDSATDTWRALRGYSVDGCECLNARPAKKGAGSIEYGIDLIDARIRTGRLKIISPPVRAILEESDSYRWDVDENENTTGKLAGPCHALDALRYLVLSIDRKRSVRE